MYKKQEENILVDFGLVVIIFPTLIQNFASEDKLTNGKIELVV